MPARAPAPRFVVVVFAALLAGLLGLAGCPKAVEADAGCRSDLDCGQNQSCNVATGRCLCIDDNACDVSEFCNLAGGCQAKLECLNNTDCDSNAGTICDTTSGECLAFDDTFLHEAWNRSTQTRVILLMDAWNPHLTDPERDAMRELIEGIGEFHRG